EAIVDTIREPLVVLNTDLKIITANKAFYENFKTSSDETEGFYISDAGQSQWNIPVLKKQLTGLISKNKSFQDFEITHTFNELGERTLLFNAMPMGEGNNKQKKILLVIEDITERRKSENELRKSHHLNLGILNSI